MTKWPQKPPLGSQIDWGDPLARGLVGCWIMNEGGGNLVNDLSGNGNGGTAVNQVTWMPGKFGYALDFPGTTDYVTVPDNDLLRFNSATQDFTACAWIRSTAASAGDYLIDKRDADNDGWNLRLVAGIPWLSVNTADVKGTVDLRDSRWHFVCGVANRYSTGQIYVDGLANGAPVAVSGLAMDTTIAMTIGTISYSVTSTEFAGQMSHIQIWNRALSASEVQRLYMEPFGIIRRPRIELWGALGGEPAAGGLIVHPGMTGGIRDLSGGIAA